MRNVLGVLAVLVVTSCGLPGAPVVGSACEYGVDQPECVGDAAMGYCTAAGKWAEAECGRCSNSQAVMCTHRVGDTCPEDHEGAGYCSSSTALMVCRGGKYEVMECASCEARDGLSFCL